MAPAYSFEGRVPVVHPTAFVHPDAVLIGDVHIDAGSYIGPCASLRGDFGRVEVGPGANVQDCCVLHCFPGRDVIVRRDGHVGHGAVLHGCEIGDDVLIGMNSVIMDAAVIGAQAFVGANSCVKSGFDVPARHLAAGSPAKLVRELTDKELAWKAQGTRTYQQLAQRCRNGGLRLAASVIEPEQGETSGQDDIPDTGWQHVTLEQYRSTDGNALPS